MKKYCHWVLETLPWWTSWDGQSYCWLSLAFLHTSDFGLFMWLAPRVDRSPQRQVVQSLSGVELFVTPWTAACQASLSFTISRRLLKLMSIELMMPSNHLILCCPFSSCPQCFPAPGKVSQLFSLDGQSIGASASASLLPMNIQSWFPLVLTGLISLLSKGLSTESSPAPQLERIHSSALNLLYGSTLTSIHDYWKNHSFDYMWKRGGQLLNLVQFSSVQSLSCVRLFVW